MSCSDITLTNLKEKTFIFSKRSFAIAADERLPKTNNTLLDENIMLKLGIKPVKVSTQRFSYAGIKTRIVAEVRFTAQTVQNGFPAGNTFVKAWVVRDLNLCYGVDAVAGGQLYTKLLNTENDDSFVISKNPTSPSSQTKRKKKKLSPDSQSPHNGSDQSDTDSQFSESDLSLDDHHYAVKNENGTFTVCQRIIPAGSPTLLSPTASRPGTPTAVYWRPGTPPTPSSADAVRASLQAAGHYPPPLIQLPTHEQLRSARVYSSPVAVFTTPDPSRLLEAWLEQGGSYYCWDHHKSQPLDERWQFDANLMEWKLPYSQLGSKEIPKPADINVNYITRGAEKQLVSASYVMSIGGWPSDVYKPWPGPSKDDLPLNFTPCSPTCAYTVCQCVRQYEGRDFMS